MRRITVVTTSRADFGIYRPILRRLRDDDGVELQVVAAGSHLVASMGHTIDEVSAEVPVAAQLDVLDQPMSDVGVARSMARALVAFADTVTELRSELVVVLGDRFEMYAAALAALPLGVPVAHLHGGEVTHGAFDDALRHSTTKLSHLHFVSTVEYATRVAQLGEEPWRITVCGAPSLDDIRERAAATPDVLERIGVPTDRPPIVVAYHPATMEPGSLGDKVDALLRAVDRVDRAVVVTAPNADPGGELVLERLRAWVDGRQDAVLVPNLGADDFAALLARAAALVGNSSAGIIEAATFELPVVNVGWRQEGRVRGRNVIDVGNEPEEIAAAIDVALSDTFRSGLDGLANPYDAGGAASIIAERLAAEPLGPVLLHKRFVDVP